ncbi:MAG: biotin transporter BioY [Eubacterium sp.]|nr:biotin transporter BioY [Eubacterium sp.]
MALFATMLCISAYISIPLPNGSHVTVFNLMLTLIALTFSPLESFSITAVWFLLGCVGVPVFIGGQGGLGYLLTPWGGYSFAFLIVAFFLALACQRPYSRIYYTAAAIVSAVFLDLFGSLWYMFTSGVGLIPALLAGFVPFIAIDLVKMVIAAQIVPVFHRLVHRNLLGKNA